MSLESLLKYTTSSSFDMKYHDSKQLYKQLIDSCFDDNDKRFKDPISAAGTVGYTYRNRAIVLLRFARVSSFGVSKECTHDRNENILLSHNQLIALYEKIYIKIYQYLGWNINGCSNKGSLMSSGNHGLNGQRRAVRLLNSLNISFTIFLNEYIKILAFKERNIRIQNALTVQGIPDPCDKWYLSLLYTLTHYVNLSGEFQVSRNDYGSTNISVASDTSLLTLIMISLYEFFIDKWSLLISPLIYQYLNYVLNGHYLDTTFPLINQPGLNINFKNKKIRKQIKVRMKLEGRYSEKGLNLSERTFLNKWSKDNISFTNPELFEPYDDNYISLAYPMYRWRKYDRACVLWGDKTSYSSYDVGNSRNDLRKSRSIEGLAVTEGRDRSASFVCLEEGVILDYNSVYIYLIYQNKITLSEPEMRMVKDFSYVSGQEKKLTQRRGVQQRRVHTTLVHFGIFDAKNYIEHGVDRDVRVLMAGQIRTKQNNYEVIIDNESGHFFPRNKDFDLYKPLIQKILGPRYEIAWKNYQALIRSNRFGDLSSM